MQSDRHLVARYWLNTARQDLMVAEDYATRLPHIACFHAQQASEKALKAAITEISGDAPRTHVSHQLIDEIKATGTSVPEDVTDAARGLDKFYAPTRYPDALGGADPFRAFTSTDASGACAAARSVVEWCATIVPDAT